jgi:hypothetical protein
MGIFRMAVPMDYPFLPIIQSFNEDEVVVSGLEGLRTMFPSEITLDSLHNTMILFQSSDYSSTMSEFYNLNPDPKVNPVFSQLNENGKILAARSEVSNNETGIVGQVILISDSKFFADNGGGGSPENHIFVLNAIDFLLIEVKLTHYLPIESQLHLIQKYDFQETRHLHYLQKISNLKLESLDPQYPFHYLTPQNEQPKFYHFHSTERIQGSPLDPDSNYKILTWLKNSLSFGTISSYYGENPM